MPLFLVPQLAALALEVGPAARPSDTTSAHPADAILDARAGPAKPRREGSEEVATGDAVLSPLASAEVLAALGPFVPEVGAWVEYRVRPRNRGAGAEARRVGTRSGTDAAGRAVATAPQATTAPEAATAPARGVPIEARVRLSVLSPAQTGGRYWLELASATSAGLAVATRMLVHGDPTAPRSIERMIVFVAGQAAFELPVAEARDPIDASRTPPPPHARVRALGPGRVRVPAGSFLADRLRVVAGDATTLLHRTAAVPLWGLVRAEGPQSTVELLGFSHQGARSLVPAQAGDDLAEAPQAGQDGHGEGGSVQGAPAGTAPAQGKGRESTK
jgi:hypothetical protein